MPYLSTASRLLAGLLLMGALLPRAAWPLDLAALIRARACRRIVLSIQLGQGTQPIGRIRQVRQTDWPPPWHLPLG